MNSAEVWEAVADERAALSALLVETDPAAWGRPSLCGAWTVKDVVAHLVAMAEAGNKYAFIAKHAFADPRFNRGIDKIAKRLSVASQPHELATRLGDARNGRFLLPLFPPVAALGEVVAHRADIRDALGLPAHAP